MGSRLDLILHNHNYDTIGAPDRLLVPQHLTLAWNLFGPGGTKLSDHLGINASSNHQTTRAFPQNAEILADPTDKLTDEVIRFDSDALHSGAIEYPYGMQWYRIDKPGGYSISAYPAEGAYLAYQFRADVYAADDLSRPISTSGDDKRQFRGPNQEIITTDTYVLPSPPYYVRVAASYTWTGLFTLLVHRHRGQNARDAIPLEAFVPSYLDVNQAGPHNPEDAVWGKRLLGQALSGTAQKMRLHSTIGGKPWTLELRGAGAMIRTCGWLWARSREVGVPPEQDRSPLQSGQGRRWRAGSKVRPCSR